jgi:hypothetical protein
LGLIIAGRLGSYRRRPPWKEKIYFQPEKSNKY